MQLRNGLFVEVARDEILIALNPDVTQAEVSIVEVAIAANFGVIYGDDTDFRILQVRIMPDRSENDFVDTLDVVPGVLDAYLNITIEVEQFATGDPTPDHFAGSYWIDQIHAREAWQSTTGDPAMTIGIVDSGFNPSADAIDIDMEPERIEQIDADGLPLSGDTDGLSGHGTAVTAFAAGDGNRADSSVGVAWLNHIVNVDMFEETFPGTTYVTGLLSAIRQAIEAGSQIVNIGVGPSPMLALNPGLETNFLAHRVIFRDAVAPALHYARRNNVLLVFSAGNDGDGADANHPLVLDGVGNPVVTVYNDNFLLGDIRELEASWTNNGLIVGASVEGFGMAPFSRQGAVVSIAAPGTDISFGDGMLYTGTSYAAALTSGAAALLHSVNPTLTAAELKYFMMDTSDPDALLDANLVGGQLDIKAAVDVVQRSLLFRFASSIDVQFTETGSTATEIFKSFSVVTPVSTVTGLVTDDAMPPNPIPGAWVGIDGGPAVMTDANGFYTITGLDESVGRAVLAAAPGFQAQSVTPVTLPLNSTVVFDFALTPVILIPGNAGPPEVIMAIDASGSMFEEIGFLQDNIDELVTTLKESFPLIRIGVATYGSFPQYILHQPLTDDATAIADAVNSISILGALEIGLDALYQAATGDGWDGNDDGDLDDPNDDIPPTMPGWSTDTSKFIMIATDERSVDADVDAFHPGVGFLQMVDALNTLGVDVLAIEGDAGDIDLRPQLQDIVDAVGGEIITIGTDGTEFVQAINNGLTRVIVGVKSGLIAGAVFDNSFPSNPIEDAMVSVIGDDPELTLPDGSFRTRRVPVGVGNWMVVSADGFKTQLVGPLNVIEDATTTVPVVMIPVTPPRPLRLTTLGDPEPFVDPASPLFVPGAFPEETHTFVLRFQNQLNRPVEDLDYTFVLHAVFNGRLFDRIPVTVHVPGG
ncbi:MAG: S8 family serine peptidase [Candidatus Hydrogenedentes bacterium]|nr:S8 family serine peptidase [Candidatus Hydrogenedentota bacterium]